MNEEIRVHIIIHGRVQGVGYRSFIYRQAKRLQLAGFVRNMPNGTVECIVEGLSDQIERLIENMRKGPRYSNVSQIEVSEKPAGSGLAHFEIIF